MKGRLLLALSLLPWAWGVEAQPVGVQIQQPTTAQTYMSTNTTLTISGTASTREGRMIRQVTWRTNRGASGVAQGTTAWSFGLTLPVGTTQVTVTAHDSRSRTDDDRVTITVLSQPPPPGNGPITLLWDYTGPDGDAFQVERCTAPCAALDMDVVADVSMTARTWIDTTVVPADDYCYRVTVATGAAVGPFTPIVCSP